jgi:YD repeat-containing protein
VTEHANQAGATVRYLHDPLGRPAGRVTAATAPAAVTAAPSVQTLLQRLEWDGNDRLASWINARGNATRYRYDALDRLVAVVGPDGATYTMERDPSGNITRAVDPNRTVITHHFDVMDRLVERRIESARAGSAHVERFAYDGLDRLVAAVTGAAPPRRLAFTPLGGQPVRPCDSLWT